MPYRLMFLAICAAALLSAAPGLLRLELRLDGMALVPPDDPVAAAEEELAATFGVADRIVIYLGTGEPLGILRADRLDFIRSVTEAVLGHERVAWGQVASLATERRDRVASFDYAPFLSPPPVSEDEIASLRADIDAMWLLKGTLVAEDYSGAAVLVDVPENADRTAFYHDIRGRVRSLEDPPVTIRIVGAPVAESTLGMHLIENLIRLLPLCLVILAVMLGWLFGNVWPTLTIFANVGASLVFTFGLMGWFGQPVFITTAVLPVVLCTVAIACEVHLVAAAQRCAAAAGGGEGEGIGQRALLDIWKPLCMAAATSAIGLGSFLVSPLPPIRAFGLWAAVGVLFILCWSVFVSPRLYDLLGARRIVRRGKSDRPLAALASIAGSFARTRRARIIAIFVLALMVLGNGRLVLQDSWIGGFSEKSAFRADMRVVNEALHGTHLLQMHIRFPKGRSEEFPPLQDPAVIGALGEIEARMRQVAGVGGVTGPNEALSLARYLSSGRRPDGRELSGDPVELRRLWRRIEIGMGTEKRKQFATDGMDETLVTLFLEDSNYRDTQKIMEAARAAAQDMISPLGGSLAFGGDVAVSQAMIAANVKGQLRSVLVAIAALFVFLLLVLRRLGEAVLTVLPVSAACLAVLGAMGWLGVPLGVATSMFIAITLGLGVDFPLHLLQRVRKLRLAQATAPVSDALKTVGPAILINTLVLSIGFGSLAFSSVPANARLGLLVAIAVLTCCACTFLLVGGRRAAA